MECKITSIGWLTFLVCFVHHWSMVDAQNCSFFLDQPCEENCINCGKASLADQLCREEFESSSCDECPSGTCYSCSTCCDRCQGDEECCIPCSNCYTSGGCGTSTFTTPTGVLLSPNYPNDYPLLTLCEYVIQQPIGSIIVLSVNYFDIEDGTACRFDYLEVRDGGTPRSPLIGKYCGSNLPPATIESAGNELYLQFLSDYSEPKSGFNITFTLLEPDCGFEIVTPLRYCPASWRQVKLVKSLAKCIAMCEEQPQCMSVLYVPKVYYFFKLCLLNTCPEDQLKSKRCIIRWLVKRGAQMWQPKC